MSDKMTASKAPAKQHLSAATFRADPMLARIERVVADLLANGKVVTPIDVLMGMGLLRREHLDDWRRGRNHYLERVITCNLTRLSRLLRLLRFHAHDLNLKPSMTVYMRHGEGAKQRLRFTKTGDPNLELAYATHFVWPANSRFHLGAQRSRLQAEVAATTNKGELDLAHDCRSIATSDVFPDSKTGEKPIPFRA